jgi:flagella basal body P-ring formation protein FlgA
MKKINYLIGISYIYFQLSANAVAGYGIHDLKAEIAARLQNELKLNSTVELQLNGYDTVGEFNIEALEIDKKRRRFNVRIINDGYDQNIKGNFDNIIVVPVLNKDGYKGQKISIEDIEYKEIPSTKLRNQVIIDGEVLLNKELASNHPSGAPFHHKNIISPALIKKGDMIAMQFCKHNLRIETKGVALENGASGNTIKVRNINSGKIIHAKVLDTGAVLTGE